MSPEALNIFLLNIMSNIIFDPSKNWKPCLMFLNWPRSDTALKDLYFCFAPVRCWTLWNMGLCLAWTALLDGYLRFVTRPGVCSFIAGFPLLLTDPCYSWIGFRQRVHQIASAAAKHPHNEKCPTVFPGFINTVWNKKLLSEQSIIQRVNWRENKCIVHHNSAVKTR